MWVLSNVNVTSITIEWNIFILFLQTPHGNSINAINGSNSCLQFEDLNDDVLLEIYDKLQFKDLINLAETSYRFRQVAQHHIIAKYRFHEKIVEISDLEFDEDITFNYLIKIYRSELQSKILRYFGHLISRISLEHPEWLSNYLTYQWVL